MQIVVLVKQVPDTWGERTIDTQTGRLDRRTDPIIDEINERAVEVALLAKDADSSTEVVILTMGPDKAQETLRKALSMGADRAVHLLDDGFADADVAWSAEILAAALRNLAPDVIITGNESTDGRGGVLPAMIAEHLGLPLLDNLDEVELTSTEARGVRRSDAGLMEVHSALPAVISVTEKIAEPRFASFKGIMGAKKKPLDKWGAADLDLPAATGASVVVSASVRPPREAGHKIKDDGTAAAQLVEFLADRRLV